MFYQFQSLTHIIYFISAIWRGVNHVVETITGKRVDSQDVINTFFQQVLAQYSKFYQPIVLLRAKVTEQYVLTMTLNIYDIQQAREQAHECSTFVSSQFSAHQSLQWYKLLHATSCVDHFNGEVCYVGSVGIWFGSNTLNMTVPANTEGLLWQS